MYFHAKKKSLFWVILVPRSVGPTVWSDGLRNKYDPENRNQLLFNMKQEQEICLNILDKFVIHMKKVHLNNFPVCLTYLFLVL